MSKFLGAHTINNGGIHMAVKRAGNAGMTAMQLFTAIPKYYGDKVSIKAERVERFKSALAETNIKPKNVLVHAAYVLSVATPDNDTWIRAAGGLAKEMERSSAIGAGQVCFHPGSAKDSERSESAKRIATAMVQALKAADSDTKLLIENTAGAGRTMGKTAEEIADILSHIPKGLRARTGYGLDTCHLFASGYEITHSKEMFRAIIDDFEEKTGEPPSFFHLNDSEGALGSNKDRHVLIGDGAIGEKPFRWLLEDPRSSGVPLVLETPQKHYDIGDDDPTPDPFDVQMMELLLS